MIYPLENGNCVQWYPDFCDIPGLYQARDQDHLLPEQICLIFVFHAELLQNYTLFQLISETK